MKTKRKILWFTVVFFLFLTTLPYLGYFDQPVLVAGIPEPLFLILLCNVVLTVCAIAIYPLYFKPLMKKLADKPIVRIE
ncbi:hypothetical protein KDD30_08680 [Photobacterium sp. GJ3]|uniref:hypothetical protein n=1 Tax=Photobacterium sp. GJ3 TaxID=2829502 RepID=UPI001B8CAD55|nr:hypothetical protein [Photobacterium sp. GJ3]QUJ66267.1 hypothetical protein KDD30_08680 [Photobacterium sp. GJ3]